MNDLEFVLLINKVLVTVFVLARHIEASAHYILLVSYRVKLLKELELKDIIHVEMAT